MNCVEKVCHISFAPNYLPESENRKWVVFLFAICETGIGNRKTVVFLLPICEIENRSISYFTVVKWESELTVVTLILLEHSDSGKIIIRLDSIHADESIFRFESTI